MKTRRALILAAALALAVRSAVAGLFLIPAESTRELEGMRFPELVFRDGNERMTYEPPRGWVSFAASAACVQFDIARGSGADFSMHVGSPSEVSWKETSAAAEPGTAGEVSALPEWLKAVLPADARNVELIEQGPAPVHVDGCPVGGGTVSFRSGGRLRTLTILFLRRKTEEIQFRLLSIPADHERLKEALIRSLFTMQWAPALESAGAASR